MVDYTYGPQPAVDITTAALVNVSGLSGSVYASEADANAETGALTVTLAAGVTSTLIPVSSFGLTAEFTVPDLFQVWWRSGVYVVHLMSFDGIVETVEANAAATQAVLNDVVLSVNRVLPDDSGNVDIEVTGGGTGGTSTWTSLDGKPSTFPPSAHTHSRSEISDASGLGRSLISATDPQAARALIGAGTGNGTSNLALGNTATTAAPGNHAHAQYVDVSTAAAIADERIAASGGGSGGGSILVWRYRSGAYPTLPETAPPGVELVSAIGPLQPSTVPSWIGNGPLQVPATYDYNGGLA